MKKCLVLSAVLLSTMTTVSCFQSTPEAVSATENNVAAADEDDGDTSVEAFNKICATFQNGKMQESNGDVHYLRDTLNEEKLDQAIEAGASINAKNANGETPLMQTHSADVLGALLDRDADVEAADQNGMTPLMHIGHHGCRPESHADMIEKDDDLNCKWLYPDEEWETLLTEYDETLSSIPCLSVCAQMLIDEGADVNARDKEGRTPLMHMYTPLETLRISDWAVDSGAYVKTLLEAGADVNAKDDHQKTVLMYASDVITIKYLIAAGADINAQDDQGNTALMSQIHDYIIPDNIIALIEAGADKTIKNNQGQTALDLLNELNVKLSKEYGYDWSTSFDEVVNMFKALQ